MPSVLRWFWAPFLLSRNEHASLTLPRSSFTGFRVGPSSIDCCASNQHPFANAFFTSAPFPPLLLSNVSSDEFCMFRTILMVRIQPTVSIQETCFEHSRIGGSIARDMLQNTFQLMSQCSGAYGSCTNLEEANCKRFQQNERKTAVRTRGRNHCAPYTAHYTKMNCSFRSFTAYCLPFCAMKTSRFTLLMREFIFRRKNCKWKSQRTHWDDWMTSQHGLWAQDIQ